MSPALIGGGRSRAAGGTGWACADIAKAAKAATARNTRIDKPPQRSGESGLAKNRNGGPLEKEDRGVAPEPPVSGSFL
jgi:hypothetical protein